MEEKKKRKGYKTLEQQYEATKRYLDNNPEAKEKRKKYNLKSYTKNYILKFADNEELEEVKSWLKERELKES
jgi:hypothetical protein